MRKIIVYLIAVLCFATAGMAYAELDVQCGSTPTIMLVVGDEDVEIANDIGITSFTKTRYLDGVPVERQIVNITEYDQNEYSQFYIKRCERFLYYYEHGQFALSKVQVIENSLSDSGQVAASLILTYTDPSLAEEYLLDAKEIRGLDLNNRHGYGNWVIARRESLLPHNYQYALVTFHTNRPTVTGEEYKISNVVVSDLAVGTIIGVIDEVGETQDNTVVLEKLDQIIDGQDQIQEELSLLDRIRRGIRGNRGYLRAIYSIVRRILRRLRQ